MKNTFTVLPIEQMKIIKRINFVTENKFNQDIIIGFIIYERNLSPTYKFDSKKTDENRFSYLVSYPKQESYPNDEIDNLILNTVKGIYPKSLVHNELLFSSIDVENLERLVKRPNEKTIFIISPDFSEMDVTDLIGKQFNCFRKSVNIYVDSSSDLIKNISLSGKCEFNRHNEIYKLLDTITFL